MGTRTTEAQSPENLIPAHIPQVIEDSITVVRELGFRYLWMDRYCVKQDNTSEELVQIQNMDSIYWESTLAIIAALDDILGGLPGVSDTPAIPNPG
jgi:hypothetical protein